MNYTEKSNHIFTILSTKNPSPKTELEFVNEYTLLVAIVCSAQATDIGVNKATKELFKTITTPQKMILLGEEGLKKHIRTIGLFNSKAKNVITLSKILISNFNSIIPNSIEELQTLPGVGRKTALVFLNCARGFDTIGVDTHVHRVSNRLGLAKSTNVLDTEKQLAKKIPKKWRRNAHHWLILHGRYICKARKPECSKCDISNYCKLFQNSK